MIINKKINVYRKFVKQIRRFLYYWERYGYQKANLIFKDFYEVNRRNLIRSKKNFNFVGRFTIRTDHGELKEWTLELPCLYNWIHGKLNYMKMVKGDNDSTYCKLKNRFDKLMRKLQNSEKNIRNFLEHRI